jgi:hypothetical protein
MTQIVFQNGTCIVPTIDDVAAFVDVSIRTAKTFLTEGCPGKENGGYNLRKIVAWVRKRDAAKIARQVARQQPSSPEAADAIEILELRKLQVAVERAEVKLQQERGELIPYLPALAQIEQMFAICASRWDAMPAEMIASLPPELQAEIFADWTERVDLMKRDLASFALEVPTRQRIACDRSKATDPATDNPAGGEPRGPCDVDAGDAAPAAPAPATEADDTNEEGNHAEQ